MSLNTLRVIEVYSTEKRACHSQSQCCPEGGGPRSECEEDSYEVGVVQQVVTKCWASLEPQSFCLCTEQKPHTGHIQLSVCLSDSRKGGGQKACRTTSRGAEEGTFGT